MRAEWLPAVRKSCSRRACSVRPEAGPTHSRVNCRKASALSHVAWALPVSFEFLITFQWAVPLSPQPRAEREAPSQHQLSCPTDFGGKRQVD